MKTWQRSLLCVLFCVVGFNSVVYAWPLDIGVTKLLDDDVLVGPHPNFTVAGIKPSIVSTPEGHLYVAYETYKHDETWKSNILICRSTDNGNSWQVIRFIGGGGLSGDFLNPSITYLERGTEKWICVVYVRVYPESPTIGHIHMYRFDPENPGNSGFVTIASGLKFSIFDEIRPKICTDYPLDTSNPYLYVVYDDRGQDDLEYKIHFSRSTDRGLTWSPPQDPLQQIREVPPGEWPGVNATGPRYFPDISFGHAGLFLVSSGTTSSSATNPIGYYAPYVLKSLDKGSSWDRYSHQLSYNSDKKMVLRPSISAAADNNSVVVAYTTTGVNDYDIRYAYSTNGGNSWTIKLGLATTGVHEQGVVLGRSLSNGRFYAAFLQDGTYYGSDIRYTSASTSAPWNWATPVVINEKHAARSFWYNPPSIATNPTMAQSMEACIVWTDVRLDGDIPNIYFDDSSMSDYKPIYPTSPFAWIDAGETMSYTVTVENVFEDLNTLTVTNQLSDLVSYASGTIAKNGVVQESLAVTDGLWTYTADNLAYGDLLTFSFDVVVDVGVDPGDLISNLINVQYVYGLSNTLLEYSREVAVIVGNVPEPATWALIGLGLLGGGLLLRRKRRA